MAFALIKGIFGGGDIYGKKPKVPELEPTTRKAITSNINLMPDLAKLAEAFNTLSQESLNKQFEQAMPGFADYMAKTKGIAESLLSGQYPGDVQKAVEGQVDRSSAAWNYARGVSGSAFGVGKMAWDRSGIPLKAFETGLSTMDKWVQLGRMRLAPSLNLGKFMISWEEQFNRDWQANIIKAAPSPTARGQFDTEMGILGMVLGAYSGGPGYQGTYKPNYGGAGGSGGGVTPLGGVSYQPGGYQPPPQYGMPAGGYGTAQGVDEGTGEGSTGGLPNRLSFY